MDALDGQLREAFSRTSRPNDTAFREAMSFYLRTHELDPNTPFADLPASAQSFVLQYAARAVRYDGNQA